MSLIIFDNADVRWHYNDLKAEGVIPSMVGFDSVTFERGGAILVDGAIDLPIIGGFDVKLYVVAKLLSDLKTIRLRAVEVKVSGIGSRGLVMMFVEKIAENFKVPGLRWVKDGSDGYIEYTPPAYVALKDLQTADNKLTLVALGFRYGVFQREMAAAELAALEASGSMADQAKAAQLKGAPVAHEKAETPTAYPAPDLKGAVNLKGTL